MKRLKIQNHNMKLIKQAAKISALSFDKIDKYRHLTSEEIFLIKFKY